jgi:cytochrome c553
MTHRAIGNERVDSECRVERDIEAKRSLATHVVVFVFAVSLTALFSVGVSAQETSTERPPDTMRARVLGCAACHGASGEGTRSDYFPRLAGQPVGYLYNQLLAFRDGRRVYPPMNYLLAYLPDDYLRQIATYFADQHPPAQALTADVADAPTIALGRSLVESGDASRGVPACIACHGAALTGARPSIPGLRGLHASYISAQLGAWRYGTRHAASPDCMHEIASRLSESDITAVAAWLAMQPGRSDAALPSTDESKLPLACGSVAH